MDLLAEVIVILIAALMPIVLAAILLFYPREEEEPENITYIPDFYAEDTMPVASLASWHPDPLWYLELTNAGTGLRIGKRFQKELILGRFIGTGEQSNMLYLDRSVTISRRHVRIMVMEDGVSAENLSAVNVARLNGRALVTPDWSHYSEHVEIGDETYIVTALSRVA